MMNKLPAITLAFWIMKICATTLGETAGDLFSMTLHIGYALSSIILISGFIIALTAQLLSRINRPWLYWTVILATSTAGTTLSDYMDRTLGLGYATGSFILMTVLAVIFIGWRLCRVPFSMQSIHTPRIELLYWTAILVSNTLGTALGDFLADDSGLGFAGGALLIASAIIMIIIAHFYTKIPQTLLFWLAFILTRPLGATVGDLLTKTTEKGGLGFGTIGSSLILALTLLSLIIYTQRHDRSLSSLQSHSDTTGSSS